MNSLRVKRSTAAFDTAAEPPSPVTEPAGEFSLVNLRHDAIVMSSPAVTALREFSVHPVFVAPVEVACFQIDSSSMFGRIADTATVGNATSAAEAFDCTAVLSTLKLALR